MTSARVCLEALDTCRMTISTEAGRFGDVGDKLVDLRPDAEAFGAIGGSAELRDAVAELGRAAGEQLHHAEKLLSGIARAVDVVATNIGAADTAARTGFGG